MAGDQNARSAGGSGPRVLLVGMGWMGAQPGGLNRYFAELLDALLEGGVAADGLVIGDVSGAPANLRGVSGPAESVPARLLAVARTLARRDRRVDVLDVHFALYGAPAVLGVLRRLPLVVHFQGPWADESRVQGDPPRARMAKRALEAAVYRRAERVVVLSNAFAELLVRRYGVAPWRVRVLAPGVRLDRFAPVAGDPATARTELGLDPDRALVVAVRRLVPRVGLDVLLRAWGQLPAGPLLALVGDGPWRDELHRLAGELGLGDHVRFVGRVDEDDLTRWYRAADVSVVPSVALEGFGLVVTESLAAGTPVVASDLDGLRDALGGLDCSLLVPPGDPAALATRLREALAGDRPSRATCRAYAEGFGWPEVAARHAALYREVAADRPISVVYLDHTAEPGGAELSLSRLLPALRGVDAHVVLAEDGPLATRLRASGISVEVLPLGDAVRRARRDQLGGGGLSAAIELGRYVLRLTLLLRRYRPDIVHANSLKACVYGSFAGRLAGVPVVWHARDRLADDYLPVRTARTCRWLADRLPATVIANSQATLDSLRLRRTRHAVVASPVEMGIRPAGRREGPFTVGLVGRIAPWKGQDLFLCAFGRAFPDGAQRAHVVGGPLFGEEATQGRLLALVEQLGIEDRVDFVGQTDDVSAELARLDVLVHCSRIPEPFGAALVEGMAAGLPVVAGAWGGPAEIVSDGQDGLLVPPEDEAPSARARSAARSPGGAGLKPTDTPPISSAVSLPRAAAVARESRSSRSWARSTSASWRIRRGITASLTVAAARTTQRPSARCSSSSSRSSVVLPTPRSPVTSRGCS